MNKLYFSVIALAFAGSASAQSGLLETRKLVKGGTLPAIGTATAPPAYHTTSPNMGQRSSFYSEDFSGGGLPTGWTTQDDLTPSGQTPVTLFGPMILRP